MLHVTTAGGNMAISSKQDVEVNYALVYIWGILICVFYLPLDMSAAYRTALIRAFLVVICLYQPNYEEPEGKHVPANAA